MIQIKKTTDLSDKEIADLCGLFNLVMEKNRGKKEFLDLFTNTVKGFSYHVMLYEDDMLIGCHTGIPFRYLKNGEPFIAGLGMDTMTHPNHRDFFHVRDMFKLCEETMLAEGCVLRVGFPNDNSYPILKKGFKYKDIGKLDTYFLPIRVGGIKKKLAFLNPLSRLFSALLIGLSNIPSSKKLCTFKYEKDRSNFDTYRYKWFEAEKYRETDADGVKVHYKVLDYEGVNTLFMIDVWPLSKKGFDKAVRKIYRQEHTNIDLIMYVGHLPFVPMSLLKMPHKIEPKHFRFTCKPLVKDVFDDSIYNIDNWDVNLSNYDLI